MTTLYIYVNLNVGFDKGHFPVKTALAALCTTVGEGVITFYSCFCHVVHNFFQMFVSFMYD